MQLKKKNLPSLLIISLALFFLQYCGPANNQSENTEESLHVISSSESKVASSTVNSMEKLQFKIVINAAPAVVYEVMTDPKHFQQWTSFFSPGSHFEGTWQKGSKMYFLSTDDNGDKSGMISRVTDHIPDQFIRFEHYGFFQNGKEITEGVDIETLKGASESYTFTAVDGGTELKVESDTYPELKAFFLETWPKALKMLKDICED